MFIPLAPPSVNHYKKPYSYRTSSGGFVQGFEVSPEAKAFKHAVAIFAAGRTLIPEGATKSQMDKLRYSIFARIHFGPRDKGDGDNFWKVIADGLVDAGVIHSDARVKLWVLVKNDEDRTNPDNPRTEVIVTRSRWAQQTLT